ncbi:MAG: amino acid adenylation domain-containing protein [Anaerolineales bacterium]|nr:amino acid adenylation domain-containing protein [Anaerolineales bacterium]
MSISNLSENKRALLEQRLQKARAKENKPVAISPRPADAPAVLSFSQRRLWFLSQWQPDNPAYNMRLMLRLVGDLDVDALYQAFMTIMQRHEVLQMVYQAGDAQAAGEPFQTAHPQPTLTLDQIDLRHLPSAEREDELYRLAHEEIHRPFDLAHDLPIRTTLLRVAADEHVLVLTIHHIATDDWSWRVLIEELMASYRAFSEGEAVELPELPIQYADFAHWQRTWLEENVLEKQLNYWRQQLQDVPAEMELPTDRPHPPIRTYAGANYTFPLPLTLSAAVQNMAQELGVTPFMILLTALQLLLQRYTGQDDIVVGSPIAGRNRSEIEGLIGFFVNTLVFRTDLTGNPTVADVLQQVRETTLAAYEHQDLPFERLVEELHPERSLSHTPIFQVLFNYHNAPRSTLALPNLRVERLPVESDTAKFDLSLAVVDTDDGIRATFNYNVDLFNEETIARMAGHFATLLEGMVSDPQQPIHELPLLTPAERQQIESWHGDTAVFPPITSVQQIFEAQVEQTPENTAVSFEEQSYTYAELNQRANQLAHHLQRLGVKPDMRVGLFVDRSLEILVGILGVIKAGGAYVPIDPIYPPDRIHFMLEDVGASILLTQAELAPELPDLGEIEIIALDADWPTVAQNSSANPPVCVEPNNLMYLLFTSGSTGQPKGVAVEHRNFVNYIQGLPKHLEVPAGLSYAMVTTFSADLGSTNVFGALCTGGQVHIISYERAADPPALADYFSRHPIDVMKLVPSHFEALQAFSGPEPFIPKHRLIFAGEACPWETIAQVQAVRPDCAIQNYYGPTETTVSALTFLVPARPLDVHTTAVPLGNPLPNVRAYILDAQRRFVPVGVPGELYIGGRGVSRGYLNRPELTEQRYLPDPWATEPGATMYRTGDRARYLPDGNIEFLGRIDQQVKIRGYRVELGEIEAILTEDKTVQDVAVILREDTPGDKRLVAYVVPADGQVEEVNFTPLRDFLRERLPSYMVPTAFVPLAKIPLNPNGKVDRKALPLPEYGRSTTAAEFIAPRSPLETDIAAIWADVLEIEQVSIDDNFFDLGGESFKAIRVVRQIGDGVSVMDLFKYPTIRELAEYLENDEPKHDGLLHELTRRTAQPKTHSLVCIPFGGASAIVFQPLALALPPDYALYSVQIPGHDFACRGENLRPMPVVAQQCATEIMETIEGPVVLYGHCVGGGMAVEIAQLLEAAGREVECIFMGGTFPAPRLPGRLFEWISRSRSRRSNRATVDFLRSLGGFSEGLDPEEQEFMLDGLRHDVEEVEDYYTEVYATPLEQKLKAPIVSIVGEMDRVAEFYEERYLEWDYFTDTVGLKTIPLAGHYFIKHQPDQLAEIIHDVLRGETAVSPTESPAPIERSNLNTFFVVAFGQLISLIGTNLTTFALSVWALEQTGQVSEFALINVFGRLPAILFAPLAGAIADRYDRRKVMIFSDVLAACSTVAVAFFFWTDSLQIWHLYITATIGSISMTFQEPAYTAAITQLIPKRYLGHANGIVQFGSATGRMLALFLGGILVITIGLGGVFIIDFVTFLFAISTLLFIRFPNTLFRMREEPLLKEITRGWDYIIKRKGLVAMIVFFAIVNFFLSIVTVLSMPLVLAYESAAVLGGVAAMLGAGMLVGGVLMGFWGGTERRMTGMIAFVGVSGLASIIMGIQPNAVYAAVGFFGLGLTGALIDAHWRTLIQTKVGLELQGRVLSTNRMLALSTMPLGALAAGPLVDRVFEPLMANEGLISSTIGSFIGAGPGRGIALLMIIVGLLRIVLASIGFSYKPLRNMEDDLPDAVPDAIIVADKDVLQAMADKQLEGAA